MSEQQAPIDHQTTTPIEDVVQQLMPSTPTNDTTIDN